VKDLYGDYASLRVNDIDESKLGSSFGFVPNEKRKSEYFIVESPIKLSPKNSRRLGSISSNFVLKSEKERGNQGIR
jgi:hypothetical protein